MVKVWSLTTLRSHVHVHTWYLAPSDYILFQYLKKKWVDTERFGNNDFHYNQGIEAIEHRREKCMEFKCVNLLGRVYLGLPSYITKIARHFIKRIQDMN